VVAALEDQLEQAKKKAREARTLGAQLDSARARCAKAAAAEECCRKALELAVTRHDEARAEKQQADAALGELMQQAATASTSGSCAGRAPGDAADVLAHLVQAVEATWAPGSTEVGPSGLPPTLAAALDQARRSMSRSPARSRGSPTPPASDGMPTERGDQDVEFGLEESGAETEPDEPRRRQRRQRTPPLPQGWRNVTAGFERGTHEEEAARIAAATEAYRAVAEAQAKRRRTASAS